MLPELHLFSYTFRLRPGITFFVEPRTLTSCPNSGESAPQSPSDSPLDRVPPPFRIPWNCHPVTPDAYDSGPEPRCLVKKNPPIFRPKRTICQKSGGEFPAGRKALFRIAGSGDKRSGLDLLECGRSRSRLLPSVHTSEDDATEEGGSGCSRTPKAHSARVKRGTRRKFFF